MSDMTPELGSLISQSVADEQVASVPKGNPFLPAHRAWTMPDRSTPGHVGEPAVASAEKGEVLFTEFTSGLVTMLQRVIDWNGSSWEG